MEVNFTMKLGTVVFGLCLVLHDGAAIFIVVPSLICLQGQFVHLVGDAYVCGDCTPGTFDPDQFNNYLNACLPCPSGSFAPGSGSTSCTACTPNSFSLGGASACSMCLAGYGSQEQSSACRQICSLGTYNGATSCVSCSAGTYAPVVNLTSPLQCPAGSYNNAVGQSYCTTCSTGKWGTALGMTSEALACPSPWVDTSAPDTKCVGGASCVAGMCGAGNFKNPADQTCVLCPAGTYQPTPPTVWGPHAFTYGVKTFLQNGQMSHNQAVYVCTAYNTLAAFYEGFSWYLFSGTISILFGIGDIPHTTINGNEYANGVYTTYTQNPMCFVADIIGGHYDCANGEWLPSALLSIASGVTVNHQCPPCPAGTYNPHTGSLACAPCSAYLSESSSPGSTACTLCIAGYYRSSGVCLLCPIGYYCFTGATVPVQCPAGYYCSGSGLSTPSVCQVGNYCPLGSVNMVPCPAGQYCMGTYLTKPSNLCSAGTYCPAGCVTGTTCSYGQYCPIPGMSAPLPASPGYYCPSVRLTAMVICPGGSYCPAEGAISPTQCEAGFYCPVGSSAQTMCSVRYYCPANQLTAMTLCPTGFYCPHTKMSAPTQCNNGTVCPLGSSTQTMCDSGFDCPLEACPLVTNGIYSTDSSLNQVNR